MKKLFLFVGLLMVSISFANSLETNQFKETFIEVAKVNNESVEEVFIQEEQELKDLIRRFCFTSVTYWYQGTTYHPMTDTYVDRYLVVTTTTCY